MPMAPSVMAMEFTTIVTPKLKWTMPIVFLPMLTNSGSFSGSSELIVTSAVSIAVSVHPLPIATPMSA